MSRLDPFTVYATQRATVLHHLIERGMKTCQVFYHEPPPISTSMKADDPTNKVCIADTEYRYHLTIEEVRENYGETQHVYLKITDDAGTIMEKRPVRYSELTSLSILANRG